MGEQFHNATARTLVWIAMGLGVIGLWGCREKGKPERGSAVGTAASSEKAPTTIGGTPMAMLVAQGRPWDDKGLCKDLTGGYRIPFPKSVGVDGAGRFLCVDQFEVSPPRSATGCYEEGYEVRASVLNIWQPDGPMLRYRNGPIQIRHALTCGVLKPVKAGRWLLARLSPDLLDLPSADEVDLGLFSTAPCTDESLSVSRSDGVEHHRRGAFHAFTSEGPGEVALRWKDQRVGQWKIGAIGGSHWILLLQVFCNDKVAVVTGLVWACESAESVAGGTPEMFAAPCHLTFKSGDNPGQLQRFRVSLKDGKRDEIVIPSGVRFRTRINQLEASSPGE